MKMLSHALLALLCVGFSGGANAGGHETSDSAGNPISITRTVKGTYICEYMRKGGDCGGTDWTLTVQSDGSRTLRAFQPLPAANSQLNGFWRLDQNFRPLEAFIHVINQGALLGSTFYAVQDTKMTAHVSTPAGLTTEIIDVPDNFSLLLHPIPADGWHFVGYDFDKGGAQTKPICVLGAAGPSTLCGVVDFKLEFLGDEDVKVPAGTFSTKHFKFGDTADIWITNDDDRHVVRHEFTGMDTRYELSSLQR